MDSEISEKELDTFLREAGILAPQSMATPHTTKDESLEKLLEEIMSAGKAPDPQREIRPPLLQPEKEKNKRFKFPLLPLWLSSAILASFLLGSVFGLYWGKAEKIQPEVNLSEEINLKLVLLVEEVQKLRSLIEIPAPSTSVSQEIIVPINPPQGMEQLAPEAFM
jgi:hypothetical protein